MKSKYQQALDDPNRLDVEVDEFDIIKINGIEFGCIDRHDYYTSPAQELYWERPDGCDVDENQLVDALSEMLTQHSDYPYPGEYPEYSGNVAEYVRIFEKKREDERSIAYQKAIGYLPEDA